MGAFRQKILASKTARLLSPTLAPPVLMSDDEALPQALEGLQLSPHEDARRLVRLFQCSQCSKPYSSPATLPCGHTFCWQCLPSPERRRNISYPEGTEHTLGLLCPTCGLDTFEEQCKRDVTLAKLMAVIGEAIAQHRAQHPDTPALLEEIPLYKSEEHFAAAGHGPAHRAVFHGGRLAGTFEMAEHGMLSYASDVAYHSQSPTGDQYEELDNELLAHMRDVVLKELDCLVCYNTMLYPTTASCGHTFCRRCLVRAMDFSSICPACRQKFNIERSRVDQRENKCLGGLLYRLAPDEVASRALAVREEEQVGAGKMDTPLFVCTVSFPTTPTFLHIFEPRYRLMMRRCMEGNRRFGMLTYNNREEPQGDMGVTRFREYGCMLEIVDFGLLPDGRSLVETRGIGRFRVVEHGMLDGYDIGRIERVEDVSIDQEKRLEAAELDHAQAYAAQYNAQHPGQAPLVPANFPDLMTTADLFRYCREYVMTLRARNPDRINSAILNSLGPPPTDPAVFPYWFASVLPIDTEEKYELLKTTTVRQRLKIVYIWIRSIEQQPWYVVPEPSSVQWQS